MGRLWLTTIKAANTHLPLRTNIRFPALPLRLARPIRTPVSVQVPHDIILQWGHAPSCDGADLPFTPESTYVKPPFLNPSVSLFFEYSLPTVIQRPFKSHIMVLQTPYVTPHILHKNYAQAHDAEVFGNSELIVPRCFCAETDL